MRRRGLGVLVGRACHVQSDTRAAVPQGRRHFAPKSKRLRAAQLLFAGARKSRILQLQDALHYAVGTGDLVA